MITYLDIFGNVIRSISNEIQVNFHCIVYSQVSLVWNIYTARQKEENKHEQNNVFEFPNDKFGIV